MSEADRAGAERRLREGRELAQQMLTELLATIAEARQATLVAGVPLSEFEEYCLLLRELTLIPHPDYALRLLVLLLMREADRERVGRA